MLHDPLTGAAWINDGVIGAAVAALVPFRPETPDQAVDMLQLWARREEMTEADLVAVQDRLFPLDQPLIDPPACPSWCTGEHVGEQVVPEVRECTSGDVYIPTTKQHVASVRVERIFDRVTGHQRPAAVRLDDNDFAPRQARALARALARAANLIDEE